tara:strand:+ start:3990 stop:6779 length:2790 start_codon:yes stop_codon:yes gene_type:complete
MIVPNQLVEPNQITTARTAVGNVTRIPTQLGAGEVTPPAQSYNFDGTSHLTSTFDPSTIGTGDITVSCWVRIPASPSGTDYVWILGNDNLDDSLALRIRSAKLEAFGRVGTEDEVELAAANPILNDFWHHVVVTRTSTTIELFVNGTSQGADTDSEAAADLSDGETWFGYHAGVANFTGDIANIEIRDGIATDSEIYNNFNTGTAYTTGTAQEVEITNNGATVSNTVHPLAWSNKHSIYFDGVNDYTEADDFVTKHSLDTTGTFSFWVKPVNATPSGSQTPFSYADENANEALFTYITTAGLFNITCRVAGTTQWDLETDASVFSDETWTHIVIVQDGVEPVLYVNGVAVATTFDTSTDKTAWLADLTGADVFRLGYLRFFSTNYNFLEGFLDEFNYWSNTALSSGQVTALYNADTPAKPSPTPDYSLHEGSGADWSGNNILSTLQLGAVPASDVPVLTIPEWVNEHSLSFNGTTSKGDVPDIAAMNNASQLTVSLWVKVVDPNSGQAEVIFAKRTDTSNRIQLTILSNILYFEIGNGSNSSGSVAFTSTDWNLITLVFDGTLSGNENRLKGYINGIQQVLSFGGTIPAITANTVGQNVTFGYFGTDLGQLNVASAGIWDVPLDADAVAFLAANPDHDLNTDSGNYDNSSDIVAAYAIETGFGPFIIDYSGNGHHATAPSGAAPTWTTDVPEIELANTYSLELDGSTQTMDADGVATDCSSHTGGTWQAWIALDDATPDVTNTIMSFGDDNADSFIDLNVGGITQTILRVSCTVAGTKQWTLGTTDLGWSDTAWHHVAIVHNGTDAKLYVDGVDVGAGYTVNVDRTVWNSGIAGLDKFTIGSLNKNGSESLWFNGKIDEVVIQEEQLSAARLLAIATATPTANLSVDSPLAWFRMGDNDGGTGSTITDQGSGSNNGTLIGSPTFSTNIH